jgi:hypothetical protein
LRADSCL